MLIITHLAIIWFKRLFQWINNCFALILSAGVPNDRTPRANAARLIGRARTLNADVWRGIREDIGVSRGILTTIR